jgi:hypothetical protein
MTTATEAEILAGVRRWAESTGRLARHGNLSPRGWRVTAATSDGGVLIVLQSPDHREPAPFWTVSPALALAWAILVESEPPPVDVGRMQCGSCDGKGEYTERSSATGAEAERVRGLERDGWTVDQIGDYASATIVRNCKPCNGTGKSEQRDTRHAAMLLLDDASGGARAHVHLPKYADRLQAAGDRIGELLMWALELWTGEPIDCGPCRLCAQREKQSGHARASVARWNGRQYPECDGSGRQLGHPHTGEAVAWLDQLTLARQAAIDEAEDERDRDDARRRAGDLERPPRGR